MAVDPTMALAMAVPVTVGLAGLCLCYAIAADANARGVDASFFTYLSPIAALAYLLRRRNLPRRTEPADRRERLAGSFGIGVVTAVIVGGIVSPLDPFSLMLYAGALIVVCVPLAFVCCYEPGWRALVD